MSASCSGGLRGPPGIDEAPGTNGVDGTPSVDGTPGADGIPGTKNSSTQWFLIIKVTATKREIKLHLLSIIQLNRICV